MHLNVVNLSSLMAVAIAGAQCKELNPRFGVVGKVSDLCFKYTPTGEIKRGVLVKCINLTELFKDIPQDIVGLTFTPNTPAVSGELINRLGIDQVNQELPFLDGDPIQFPNNDIEAMFYTWRTFVGLPMLSINEVELSTDNNYLYVSARNSIVFCGEVGIKIK